MKFDLLIAGGEVLDPGAGLHGVMNIAIDGRRHAARQAVAVSTGVRYKTYNQQRLPCFCGSNILHPLVLKNLTRRDNVKQALCVLLGSFMLTMPPGVLAQSSFPEKPVRIIVGFAAGGSGADLMARLIAPRLSEWWRQGYRRKPAGPGREYRCCARGKVSA